MTLEYVQHSQHSSFVLVVSLIHTYYPTLLQPYPITPTLLYTYNPTCCPLLFAKKMKDRLCFLYVQHSSFVLVVWLIHSYNPSTLPYNPYPTLHLQTYNPYMLHTTFCHENEKWMVLMVRIVSVIHSCVWYDSFTCVIWPIHVCDAWLLHRCEMTHVCVWYDVRWHFHVCDIAHSHVCYDSLFFLDEYQFSV